MLPFTLKVILLSIPRGTTRLSERAVEFIVFRSFGTWTDIFSYNDVMIAIRIRGPVFTDTFSSTGLKKVDKIIKNNVWKFDLW